MFTVRLPIALLLAILSLVLVSVWSFTVYGHYKESGAINDDGSFTVAVARPNAAGTSRQIVATDDTKHARKAAMWQAFYPQIAVALGVLALLFYGVRNNDWDEDEEGTARVVLFVVLGALVLGFFLNQNALFYS